MSAELEPILVWESPPLLEVIRRINKFSNNVMTRQLLYTLGLGASAEPDTDANAPRMDAAAPRSGSAAQRSDAAVPGTHHTTPGTRAAGVEAIRDHIESRGLSTAGLVIDNGSGLSRETRISAQLLVDILRLAQEPPYGAEFVASMSIGGLDGTTSRRFDGDEALGRSHLKTGSIDHVAAIAGYVHALSGKTYVAAAMINATDTHRGTGEDFLDELIRWAYELP